MLFELKKAADNLHRLALINKETFLTDPDKNSSAKYNFIVAIEAIIDMANHIISSNNFRTPENYADTFRVLHQAGALSEKVADNLIKMAKFRNRLVHLYWEVDDDLLYSFLQQNLGDLANARMELSSFINGG
jgi:uncharacterized protein YutE (UPF0331/DUF86 family)